MRWMTAALLCCAIGGSAAAFAPPARPLPPPLLPLSEADMDSIRGSGCESSWGQDSGMYVFLIESRMVVRTAPGPAGLHACPLSQAEEEGWGNGGPAVACGGRTFSMRKVGRVIGHSEADSAEGDAILTMSDGRNTRRIRGGWGTAC